MTDRGGAIDYASLGSATEIKTLFTLIAEDDLRLLRDSAYHLCFAKRIAGKGFTVVWQSYTGFLTRNEFSWTARYELFGSTLFLAGARVRVSTNTMGIHPGEKSVLNSAGLLDRPFTGGPLTAITMVNEYGLIHPGLSQESNGIDGSVISTPTHASETLEGLGDHELIPTQEILVWFEQEIQTGTMIRRIPDRQARSREIVIDLGGGSAATIEYRNQEWSILPL